MFERIILKSNFEWAQYFTQTIKSVEKANLTKSESNYLATIKFCGLAFGLHS